MLKEIKCEKFNLKNKTIYFQRGLNVVLGDNIGTNSIGKSISLMIIDFVFGGNSFIDINKDVINNLGHHAYEYCFEFENKRMYFLRKTNDPKIVYKCDANYNIVSSIKLKNYNMLLAQLYSIPQRQISFRSMVGLYSRIWGKNNYSIEKPLNIVPKQKSFEAIKIFLSVFNKYDEMKNIQLQYKNLEDENKLYKRSMQKSIIPNINKTLYNKNEKQLENLISEFNDIKKHLASYALDINELLNDDIRQLRKEKDNIVEIRNNLYGKLERLEKNEKGIQYVKKKNFEKLVKLFPNINVERLEEIELFHQNVSRYLKQEIRKEKNETQREIDELSERINKAKDTIEDRFKNIEKPSYIVDRVQNLAEEYNERKKANYYYKKVKMLDVDVKVLRENIDKIYENSIEFVSGKLNSEIREISQRIYRNRIMPELIIQNKNYHYKTVNDTGTGKAYQNLLLFDIALFNITSLPFIIHDSFLFKNVEVYVMSKIIDSYQRRKRQVFISIDEVNKYGKNIEAILHDHSVLKLSNESMLYTKDWRYIKGK